MKEPKPIGSPIDGKRMESWLSLLNHYRHAVSEDRIRTWMKNFANSDQDTIARLLDCVELINNAQIRAAFKATLESLPGWDRSARKRKGKWRFAPYSKSAGESGDTMLHMFRHANNLSGKQFDELFIHKSEIVRDKLGFDDTLVFVDDFVGSGQQVCEYWDNTFGELVAEVGSVYLVVVAACNAAIQKVTEDTELRIEHFHNFTDSDNYFHSDCKTFTNTEKKTVLKYCKRVDRRKPKGHGDCGLILVFGHSIPNNSLPILHKSTDTFEPLFKRYN